MGWFTWGNEWGIKNLVSGAVYAWASCQADAELMWAATGAPQRFEVGRLHEGRWEPCPQATLRQVPRWIRWPADFCQDRRVVGMVLRLSDGPRELDVVAPPCAVRARRLPEQPIREVVR